MGVKQALTRFLMGRLPVEEQAAIAADVIAWRFADLSAAGRQQRIDHFGPGLVRMMREGRVGLPLLIFHHLRRLWPPCWLARRVAPASRVYGDVAAADDPKPSPLPRTAEARQPEPGNRATG